MSTVQPVLPRLDQYCAMATSSVRPPVTTKLRISVSRSRMVMYCRVPLSLNDCPGTC